jgi:hypothetical protein
MLYIFFMNDYQYQALKPPKRKHEIVHFFVVRWGGVGTITFPYPDPQHSNKEGYVEAQF